MKSAMESQIGGNHYKKLKVQPAVFSHANNMGFIQGEIIAHVVRYRDKNQADDLQKAIHYLQMLLELDYCIKSDITYNSSQERIDYSKVRYNPQIPQNPERTLSNKELLEIYNKASKD